MYKKGFTLMEFAIGVGIFSVIMIGITRFARETFFYSNIFNNTFYVLADAKKAIRPFTQEVRNIRRAETGAYGIEEASPSQFVFYSDINSDRISERIRYFLDTADGTIKKGVTYYDGDTYPLDTETVTTLMNGVINESVVFQYYDSEFREFNEPNCADGQAWMSFQVNAYQNSGSGDFAPTVYVGGDQPENAYDANSTDVDYILIHDGVESQIDPSVNSYDDVAGLAVERTFIPSQSDNTYNVKVVLHGGSGAIEKVRGVVNLTNTEILEFGELTGSNSLEGNHTDGSGIGDFNTNDDELYHSSPTATDSLNFEIGVNGDSDGFYFNYAPPTAEASCSETTPPLTTVRMISFTAVLDLDPNRSPLPLTISTQGTVRSLRYVE